MRLADHLGSAEHVPGPSRALSICPWRRGGGAAASAVDALVDLPHFGSCTATRIHRSCEGSRDRRAAALRLVDDPLARDALESPPSAYVLQPVAVGSRPPGQPLLAVAAPRSGPGGCEPRGRPRVAGGNRGGGSDRPARPRGTRTSDALGVRRRRASLVTWLTPAARLEQCTCQGVPTEVLRRADQGRPRSSVSTITRHTSDP